MNNEDFDHAEVDVEKDTGRLPTTYLTRSSRPNISNASTATALLRGWLTYYINYENVS